MRYLTSMLFALALASASFADGLPGTPSKVWTPYTPVAGVASAGSFYLGAIGSWAGEHQDLDEGLGRLGASLGYLAKLDNWGFGGELELLRQVGQADQHQDEFDNWDLGVRGRIGYFFTPTWMPYATAGWARLQATETLVYGLGVEVFSTSKLSVRAEMLKYGDDALQDVVDTRLSLSYKF